jgi:hypothetical protein
MIDREPSKRFTELQAAISHAKRQARTMRRRMALIQIADQIQVVRYRPDRGHDRPMMIIERARH